MATRPAAGNQGVMKLEREVPIVRLTCLNALSAHLTPWRRLPFAASSQRPGKVRLFAWGEERG